jgi:capsular polysaccharide biosynthesis protein/Mrp family chromosome partitioning ATPase
MRPLQEADSFEFAGYLAVLRRRWPVVLVLACVGILAAGAYIVESPKAYTATTTVNVTPTGVTQTQGGAVAGGRTNSAVNLDTETQIVRSSSVAAIAGRALHSALTPAALAAKVSVAVPANSSVLQISCQARTAQQASACANAFGAAYLQNRNATAAATTNSQLKTLQNELTSLEKSTTRLTLQIASLPANSPQRATAESQLQAGSGQLKALANQVASLSGQAAASSGGSIITKATPPATPSSPKKKIILPSGLLAGLLIGLIIAFAWDRRDTTIKDARNLGQFGVPTLLAVSGKDLDREPLASPRSAAGLEFTEVARSMTAGLGQDDQLLMVMGASPGPGATVTATNLAVALARTHSPVILVCPAGQGTAELLGLPESRCLDTRGAAELAAGELSLDELALQPAGFPGLRVVVLSADLHDLPHAQARRLAGQLRGSADYAVIQVSAQGTGPDSLALAEYCAAALLAVEISATKRPDIEDSIRRLGRLGTPVAGLAVLSRLRLPARTSQDAGSLSARLRKSQAGRGDPVSAASTSPAWPDPAKDGEDNPTVPVHVDATDGTAGTD